MSATETVKEVSTAVRQVSRQFPEAHSVTRYIFRRDRAFRIAAARVRDLTFAIDPVTLEDGQYDEVCQQLNVAVRLVEAHLLAGADDLELAGIRTDLTFALDGLKQGLPADPRKRPTSEELQAEAGARILAALQR